MFICIYREPPYGTSNLKINDFMKDVDNFLDEICVRPNKLILLGDFNIHMNKPFKSDVSQFSNLLSSNGFEQHITKPTHRLGNTLDLVISRPDDDVVLDWTVKVPIVSDHFQVYCTINRVKPDLPKITRSMRNFRNFDQPSFGTELKEKISCVECDDINDMVTCYTDICNCLLDKYAPVTTKSVSVRCRLPWYNDEIREARRKRRKFERKWRKSHLDQDHLVYLDQAHLVNDMIIRAKTDFFRAKISEANSKDLFSTVNNLLNRSVKSLPMHDSASELSNKFSSFFKTKIDKIMVELNENVCNDEAIFSEDLETTHVLNCFSLATVEEVEQVMRKLSNKTCLLATLPTWILKQNISTVSPLITMIVNASLQEGIFPNAFKKAIVRPVLKKSTLDVNVLKNYRPISNI
ncbi:uncharacterized protein [Amphiura filiformis]|uniref:uncharacterized protein n=1 Tax=Amphiura filiformis TaxID=82378 RepID=UPI003B215ACB